MRKVRWLNLGQHGIQNPPGDSNHPLPHATHVGGMGRMKDPYTAFFTEEPKDIRLLVILKEYFQLFACPLEICATIGAYELHPGWQKIDKEHL